MSKQTAFGAAKEVVTEKKSLKQIMLQAAIVGVSAIITWILGNQADIDLGQYSALIVAILTLLGNVLKEWMAKYFNGENDDTPPSPVI